MHRLRLTCLLLVAGISGAITAEPEQGSLNINYKSFYNEKTNILYVPLAYKYKIKLESDNKGIDEVLNHMLGSSFKEHIALAPAINMISIPTISSTGIQIYADGVQPKSEISLISPQNIKEFETLTYGQYVEVSFSSDDKESGYEQLYFVINDSAYQKWVNQKIRLEKTQKYQIWFFAHDKVGNKEAVQKREFFLDSVPPVSTVSIDGVKSEKGGILHLGPMTRIQVNSKDEHTGIFKTYYRIDAGKDIEYQEDLSQDTFKPGPHKITYHAVDLVSNKEAERSFSIIYDDQAPTIILNPPKNHIAKDNILYVNADSELEVVVKDDLGDVTSIAYKRGDDKWQPYQGKFKLGSQHGLFEYSFKAKDDVQNEANLSAYYFVDAKPPLTEMNIAGEVFEYNGFLVAPPKAPITLKATDPGVGVKAIYYCLDQGPCQSYKEPLLLSEERVYSLAYYSVDELGNSEERKMSKIMIKARSKSNSSQTLSQKKQWYFTPKHPTGPAGKEFFLRIADGPEETARSFVIKTDKDLRFAEGGQFNIKTSFAGKKTTYRVDIDNDPPQSSHKIMTKGSYEKESRLFVGQNLTISLSTTDDFQDKISSGVSDLFYSLDGQPFASYKKELSDFQNQREYTLKYYGQDMVGNAETVKALTFTLDLTPPKSSINEHSFLYVNILSPKATLSSVDKLSGLRSLNFTFDEAPFQTYSAEGFQEHIHRLTEGKHDLKFFGTDQVLNVETAQVVPIIIDRSPPSVTFEVDGTNYVSAKKEVFINKRSRVRFIAEDVYAGVKSLQYKREKDQKWLEYRKSIGLDPVTKIQSVEVKASDLAQNTTNVIKFDFFVDNTPPKTRIDLNGTSHIVMKKIFVAKTTALKLIGEDEHSGIAKTYYRLNNEPLKEFSGPLFFSDHVTSLVFYSIDNVTNKEATQEYKVIIDDIAPVVYVSNDPITYDKDGKKFDFSKPIYIHAFDPDSGIQDVSYSINDGDFVVYKKPFRLEKGDLKRITVLAKDWNGNVTKVVYQ